MDLNALLWKVFLLRGKKAADPVPATARLRDWFYYRARRSTVPDLGKLDGKAIAVIGDAAVPGKTRDAVESAFKAALLSAQSPQT